MSEIKILLVDDHKLIRDGLKLIINTSDNIKVIGECGDGKEAISYLKRNADDIDLVLMDIAMPKMNGVDATKIITELYPRINVLALTMHVEETYIMNMIKAGALGYILKDSGREKLIEAIKTVYRKEKYYSNEVSLKLIDLLLHKDKVVKQTLTERETEILKLISNGYTNKEVADFLFISSRTVESHRRNILKKLKLRNTAELIKYALSNSLV
ncbi:MAG: response regulator transcription factor [Flavobacteriales bacterium]|nr:response regulator transcription factor [Flavobacteriales bacterium]